MERIARMSAPRCHGTVRVLLASVAALAVAIALGGCGGGVDVVAVVDSPPGPPPITALSIRLTQVGPATVQVDWSDDPAVYQYSVERNGYAFANVIATSIVDASVAPTGQYCYQVSGYSFRGDLLATTDTACIVVAP